MPALPTIPSICPLRGGRGAAVMIALAFATFAAGMGSARAASPDEALAWLSGRWSEGSCEASWMQFDRDGPAWTYRELAYENGKPYPATATADAAGVVTVRIMMPDGEYKYVNTFRDRNSLDAVETFTSATVKGEPSSHAYTRCK
jgi:hypothetical protein